MEEPTEPKHTGGWNAYQVVVGNIKVAFLKGDQFNFIRATWDGGEAETCVGPESIDAIKKWATVEEAREVKEPNPYELRLLGKKPSGYSGDLATWIFGEICFSIMTTANGWMYSIELEPFAKCYSIEFKGPERLLESLNERIGMMHQEITALLPGNDKAV